jgi:hypothetical protein
MTYNYLPEDERYSDSKLNGIYRVSFEVKVSSKDELSLSDVTQALTEGFDRGFGEGFVDKVAELSVEKIVKKAVKVLRVGDKVQLKSDLQIKANVYNDDGYLYVGNPSEISEIAGENADLNITAGSIGYINKISNNIIEVADLDRSVEDINIDLITVNAEQLEKIDSEEVK